MKEGELIGQKLEAEILADRLNKVKNGSWEDIVNCCICLYTMESFLYKLVNTTLRNEDISKVDTLGAYCHFLSEYIGQSRMETYEKKEPPITVYRGCTLTDEIIKEYKQAIGQTISWLSFTSTSKDRRQAEQFGNTLFIITTKNSCSFSNSFNDISSRSVYPHEQEVLLNAQHHFKVEKIERDSNSGKYVIYLSNISR